MKNNILFCTALAIISISAFAQDTPSAADEAAELAKKLSNPVASLISAPFQNNTDYGIGPNNGTRNTMNFQPVVPLSLSEKWNLINRLILPVITQYNVTAPGAKENGVSDAVLTAFFSPKQSKFIWGVGPAILIPSGNDDLSSKQFGAGPSALVLQQKNGWTYGVLANQIWGTGSDQRPNVNQMFVQPFLVHNWKSGAGLGGNAEWTQNWEANTTVVWINPVVSGITSLGKQKVSLAIGPRFNIIAPEAMRADWGWRAVVTFVFPK